jgi:hypothetical protein
MKKKAPSNDTSIFAPSVTMEPLLMRRCFVDYFLISLPIEGYYTGLKIAVFWNVFAAVNMMNVFWYTTPFGSSKSATTMISR